MRVSFLAINIRKNFVPGGEMISSRASWLHGPVTCALGQGSTLAGLCSWF